MSSKQVNIERICLCGLPSFWLLVAENRHRKMWPSLSNHFEPPSEVFRLHDDQPNELLVRGDVVWLRESNSDLFYGLITGADKFIVWSIEWAPDSYRVIADGYAGYTEYEMRRLLELELPMNVINSAAALMGFGGKAEIDELVNRMMNP